MIGITSTPPVHCCVESQWLPDNDIVLNLHPDTPLLRLLQYTYEQIKNSTIDNPLLDIEQYTLQYNQRELPLTTLLRNVDPFKTTNVFLRFNFNQRQDVSSTALNYQYAFEKDFDKITLRVKFNTLFANSHCPIDTLQLDNLSLKDIKGSKLLKLILHHIIDLENDTNISENLCSTKEKHSIYDFLAFKSFGDNDSHIVLLNNGKNLVNDTFMDSSLRDALNLDFLPTTDSVYTVMLYIKHSLSAIENSIDLHFISDFPLIYNNMKINSTTKISDIIKFIKDNCILYDRENYNIIIKLISKGKILTEKDSSSSNDAFFINSLNEEMINKDVNIHVQISTDKKDTDHRNPDDDGERDGLSYDTFWFKNFSSDTLEISSGDNLSHSPTISSEHDDNVDEIDPSLSRNKDNQDTEEDHFFSDRDDKIADMDTNILDFNDGRKFQLFTESGLTITPLPGTYTKCLIDNEGEVFIETKYIQLLNAKINLPNNLNIPLDTLDQVRINENSIELENELVEEIEQKIDIEIIKETASAFVENSDTTEPKGSLKSKIIDWSRNFISFMWLVLNTLYLLLRGAVFLFLILFELTSFLPAKYILLITLVCIVRTFMTNRDILNLWIEYFNLNSVSEETIQKIQKFIDMGTVTEQFYLELIEDDQINKLFRIEELHDIRYSLYERYDIDYSNDRPDEECLNELLTKFKEHEIPKRAMDILISKIIIADEIEHIDNDSKLVNHMLLLIKRYMETRNTSEYPLYKRLLQKLKIVYDRFYRTNPLLSFLDHIVPNPVKNNWFVNLLKNVILFIILLIPLLNGPVDKILTKRQKEIEEYRRQQATTRRNSNNNNSSTANSGSPDNTDNNDDHEEDDEVPLLHRVDVGSDTENSEHDEPVDQSSQHDDDNVVDDHDNNNTAVEGNIEHVADETSGNDSSRVESKIAENRETNTEKDYESNDSNKYKISLEGINNDKTIFSDLEHHDDEIKKLPEQTKRERTGNNEEAEESIQEEESVEVESSVSTETPIEISPLTPVTKTLNEAT